MTNRISRHAHVFVLLCPNNISVFVIIFFDASKVSPPPPGHPLYSEQETLQTKSPQHSTVQEET